MRQSHKQRRAKRERWYRKVETRLKFLIADQPDSIYVQDWKSKLAKVQKSLDYFENSPYLLAHDPELLEKIDLRLVRIKWLAKFYMKVNNFHKYGKDLDQIIMTKYWKELVKANIAQYGKPFPVKYFWRLRTLTAHFKRRKLKLLSEKKPIIIKGDG